MNSPPLERALEDIPASRGTDAVVGGADCSTCSDRRDGSTRCFTSTRTTRGRDRRTKRSTLRYRTDKLTWG